MERGNRKGERRVVLVQWTLKYTTYVPVNVDTGFYESRADIILKNKKYKITNTKLGTKPEKQLV